MTTTDLQYDDPIPDGEFIVRYCRGCTWKRRSNGKHRIKAGAFKSGSSPLYGISVNWMGYFSSDDNTSLNEVCETTTYGGINENGLFVKLSTSDIRKIQIESLSERLDIKYRPECDNKNPSHSEILPTGEPVFKALATLAKEQGVMLEVPENFRK